MDKVILERKLTDKNGETVSSQFIVHTPVRPKKYLKVYRYPDVEIPLYFLSVILDTSYKSPEHLGLCFDTFRVVDKLENVGRTTIQRYIRMLCDCEFLLKLKRGTYLINPGYVHIGSAYATQDAINKFDAYMRQKYTEEGRSADEYIPVWDTRSNRGVSV